MRIALIGQAPFGAAVFQRLVEDGHEIVGVFTPPEREGGRADALAQAARDAGIALQQPRRWQRRGVVDEAVATAYEATAPELNVMAFVTQIIPTRVLEFPPLKTIQYHPSMLPKHRGRSAINHSIVEGDAMTGVSIFWVDEGLDTGPILLQVPVEIGPEDTINSLYRDKLFPLGVQAMSDAVKLVAAGQAPRHQQVEEDMTYEGPWEGDIAQIDFSQPAQTVHNLIRGSDRAPEPGARSTANASRSTAQPWPLPRARRAQSTQSADAGVTIACGDGAVTVDLVRTPAGQRVAASEWAAESGITAGAAFEPPSAE